MSDGRVYQVNLGTSGLPKLPVSEAMVTRLGLEGDRQREQTLHGGPLRAICLFGIEVIERLQAEGHPTEPGGVGENLTTVGVEWSTLPGGTRVEVGDEVILELTTPANPCSTQKPNFRDGRFGRISVLTHPTDSRMYASVLREGTVRTGDPIVLLPPVADSAGMRAHLMARIDRVEQHGDLGLWAAANAGGWSVAVMDDGELSVSAAPDIPTMAFNHAVGLRTLPHLLPRVVAHFDRHGVVGWLPMHEQPWPDARPDFQLPIFAAPTSVVEEQPVPVGVTIRRIEPEEWRIAAELIEQSGAMGFPAGLTTALTPHLLGQRDVHAFVAFETDGRAAATSTLRVSGRVGLLRTGVVRPDMRGRGLQRALIAARAQFARELGCDVVTAQAGVGTVSTRNLLAVGLEQIAVRDVYRYKPTGATRTTGPLTA